MWVNNSCNFIWPKGRKFEWIYLTNFYENSYDTVPPNATNISPSTNQIILDQRGPPDPLHLKNTNKGHKNKYLESNESAEKFVPESNRKSNPGGNQYTLTFIKYIELKELMPNITD